jgi:hypothetical protein
MTSAPVQKQYGLETKKLVDLQSQRCRLLQPFAAANRHLTWGIGKKEEGEVGLAGEQARRGGEVGGIIDRKANVSFEERN